MVDLGIDERVTFRSHGQCVSVRVPRSDLDHCLGVSWWRVLLTLFSLALVVTDIPRTGLTLNPSASQDRVSPGVVACWGPYEYAVAHVRVENDDAARTVNASCDGEPLAALDVWAFKFDSLSIAPRALAQRLAVRSYPPCVLYHGACASPQLPPSTVLEMWDGLVTALQAQYFARATQRPVVFSTSSNWVDRVHQFLFRFLTKNPETRFHSVYHVSSMRGLCDPGRRTAASRPVFCDHAIRWNCDHPTRPTGTRQLPIWDHMALRVDDLQRRYADLELDVTLFVSTIVEQAHSDRHVLPSVSQSTDAMEITTLIRGRRCSNPRTCRTEFVDDYRYERVVAESDADLWKPYLSVLRGLSQSYAWLRVSLLVGGCYCARACEPNYRHRPVWRIWLAVGRTVVKIPGQTIVYGSWLPMLGYAVAHHFDSALIHMRGEYAWSSIGGLYDFRLVDYVVAASVQMRNIWMLVIVWKLVLRSIDALSTRCQQSLHPERRGVLAFRSVWMGPLSWLTTLSLVRSLAFRDTDIVTMVELPRHISIRAFHRIPLSHNLSDYGVRFDLKAGVAAHVLVVGAALCFSTTVRLLTGRPSSLFVCRSFYVPLSAGRLWFGSALDTYWSFSFRKPKPTYGGPTRIGPALQSAKADHERRVSSPTSRTAKNERAACDMCAAQPSPLHWRSTQGCTAHEPLFHISRRSKPIWSMIRLTNLVVMTDPLVLFRLYVMGKPLYVYRIHESSERPPYDIVLPTSPAETIPKTMPTDATTRSASDLVFVRVVNSRDVPWHVLVSCG